MSARWTCLRCGKLVPSGMPAALVTEGSFVSEASGRTFTVAHESHEALCHGCLEALRNGDDRSLKCTVCQAVIQETDWACCQACHTAVVEHAPPRLVPGAEVPV